jgi:hypothetical protein
MADITLDVPYYSQIDSNSELNSYWQRRSCGILALKMVIDFYRMQDKQPPVDTAELFEKAMACGGVNEAGNWYHSTIVRTAYEYDLLAWRRRWAKAESDWEVFRAEGVNEDSLKLWEQQSRLDSLYSLTSSITRGWPVIVSVARDFDEVDKPHLVVVTGFKSNGEGVVEGFYFNDPYASSEDKQKNHFVSIDHFKAKWNWMGIFVVPKGAQL